MRLIRHYGSWLGWTLIFMLAGLVLLVSLSYLFFSSPRTALAYLSGERLITVATSKSFDSLEVGKSVVVRFPIDNLTGRTVVLIGGSSSCTCTRLEHLPKTIRKGSRSFLEVTIHGDSGKIGPVSLPVQIYTDCPGKDQLIFHIEGTITGDKHS